MDDTRALAGQAYGRARDIEAQEHDEFRRLLDDQVSQYFRAHAAHVVASLVWRYGRTEDAQDVTQEAFLRLHQALLLQQRIDDPVRWVKTVAFNLLRDRLKHERYRPTISNLSARESAMVANQPARVEAPDEEFSRRQRETALRTALPSLSPIERRFLHARINGLKLREIGAHVHMSIHRVHDTITRALNKLREQVGE